MTADINIGDNYELDEDSNGDLVIRDSTGNTVLEHTDGGGWDVLRPIADEEYRIIDSNRNVVGTLFAESDGTLKLQEGTSGSDNELSLETDGTVGVGALDTPIEAPADISNSRSIDTNYTNSSGALREVSVVFLLSASTDNGLFFAVDGETVDELRIPAADVSGDTRHSMRALVPDGASYEVIPAATNGATIQRWSERDFKL